MTLSTLVQADAVDAGQWLESLKHKPPAATEKELSIYRETICGNQPTMAGQMPAEFLALCGTSGGAPTETPSTFAPEAPLRGPILLQEIAHALATYSSVSTINTLTTFGALVTPAGNFPADWELLPGNGQTLYQLNNLGSTSRYDSAGVNTAGPTIAPPPGGSPAQTWSDMAVDPTSGLTYAIATNCTATTGTSTLATIDLLLGTSVVVGTVTNSFCPVGLAADNAGNLWAHDILSDSLISVNKVTGAGTVVGPLGFNANFGQSMDCDPSSGTCYLFAFNATTGVSELRSLNLGTGASTLVGVIGSVAPGGVNQIPGGVFGFISSCTVDADCQDGNLCNGAETCAAPNCVAGTPVTCPNDGQFCTIDVCVPATGNCGVTNSCSDGNGCTVDTCDEAGDVCNHLAATPVQFCNTGNIQITATGTSGISAPYPSNIAVTGLGITASLCQVSISGYRHTFPDDVDVMLAGPAGGSQNATIMSDVGTGNDLVTPGINLVLREDAATSLPDAATLTSGTFKPTNITDGVDAFPAPAPAPTHLGNYSPFNNINPNGTWALYVVDDAGGDTGAFAGGWCLSVVVSGCTTNTDCADGNPCNGNETCSGGGVCQPGTPLDCDDEDVCTSDSCNPGTGLCQNPAVVCNDNNPCTTDSCNSPTIGCEFAPNTLPCQDGNPCTTPDVCGGGTCNSGPGDTCDDANACTSDACDALIGCYHTASSGGACNDSNVCTDADTCSLPCSGSFSENFDGVTAPALPPGWTTQLITGLPGDIAWRTAASTDTAPNGGNTDDPAHVTDKVLVSPSLPAGATQITFRNNFDTEASPPSYYDGGVLEIKIGAGAFTDIITAGGSFVTGGYTGAIATNFSSPIAGRMAWSGTSGGFITTTVNLPPASVGQNTILRWRMATDISVSDVGWTIDTITATTCSSACSGTPLGSPGEVTGDMFAPDKQTYSWSATALASQYDVVRGSVTALPVGPGGGDEVCFPDIAGTSLVDAATPAAGASNWYLVRGENTCAAPGGYGTQSNLTPRITTTCP